MSNVKTAMIILHHNDEANLKRLLREVAGFREIDRIIVADNTGAGGVAETYRGDFPKIDVITVENNGYARGNNEAIRYLKQHYGNFDYLIISNPDVSVRESSVALCLAFLEEHPQFAAAAPRMFLPDGTPHHLTGWKEKSFLCDFANSAGILSRTVGIFRETYPPEHWKAPVAEVDCLAGSFFVIRDSAFRRAGYFDEKTFLYYEEDILGFKLKKLGYRLAVLTEESFIHSEGASVSRSMSRLRKYWRMQKSRLYFQRNYRNINFLQYLALLMATALGTVENGMKIIIFRLKERDVH